MVEVVEEARVLQKWFAGTYFHILNMENEGKYECNTVFAISTVLSILMMISLAVAGLLFASENAYILESYVLVQSSIVLMLVAGCVLIFSDRRYKTVLEAHLDNRKAVTRYALILHIAMGFIFISGMLFTIARM